MKIFFIAIFSMHSFLSFAGEMIDHANRVRLIQKLIPKENITTEIIKSEHYIHSYLVMFYNNGELIGQYNPKFSKSGIRVNEERKKKKLQEVWDMIVNPDTLCQELVSLLSRKEDSFTYIAFEFHEKRDSESGNLRIDTINLINL